MSNRTYLDACLLMAAFKGKDMFGQRALEILDNPERTFIVSDAVWLEVMPKPRYEGQDEEVAFYEGVFEQAEQLAWCVDTLYRAYELAERHGIAAMDAIHVAFALDAGADELVTAEKPNKPMFRVTELTMRSIRQG